MKILLLTLCLALAACGDIPPDQPSSKTRRPAPEQTATSELASVPQTSEAVGTVQARTDVRVEAQVTGRVLEVRVNPGDAVSKGAALVVLDSRQSESRLEQAQKALESARSGMEQARKGVASAKAAHDKAQSTYNRMKTLRAQKVVTEEETEKAETAYLQTQAELSRAQAGLRGAKADVEQAEKAVQEAEIGLDYTTITAQENGDVAKRFVDPGDLAFPGKELLTLQTGGSLRLEAQVREGLIGRLHIGQSVPVVIAALGPNAEQTGIIREIEPLADPTTRSFVVKADLPDLPGLYPGMFGRLLVPLEPGQAVLVPQDAVRRIGQLETVLVKSGEDWQRIHVRTGRRLGDKVEILSGLTGGETVAVGGTTR